MPVKKKKKKRKEGYLRISGAEDSGTFAINALVVVQKSWPYVIPNLWSSSYWGLI